jgi:tRNA-specific 2-thiouridylase
VKRRSVLVAMSGGVDSSVAAALLLEQGYEVVGVTMKLWGGDSDTGCCSVSDVDDARRVAQQVGIDHLVFNFSDDFDRHVVGPYVAAHVAGRTPNPCVACNRHVKFDRLLRRADLLGFDAVATGHHAQVVTLDRRRHVARGVDRAKDQSYVLHLLSDDVLARVRFPVGELTKAEVRDKATRLGLRTAAKPDSQDVCFITSTGGRAAFLAQRVALRPGTVVDQAGRPVGHVDAVELVTVGQRRGLGLAGGGDAAYAVEVDTDRRRVVVGSADDLLTDHVELIDLEWAGRPAEGELLAQCSAHAAPRRAVVSGSDLRWLGRERRVAAGQSVVLYDPADRVVVGAGTAAG